MAEERKLTTIDLPNKVADMCGPILDAAGFTVGTSGSGWVTFERDGEISEDEQKTLTAAMTEELFSFETEDLEDDEDG